MLLAVFIANIMAAGTGFSAPADWLEHEKSHYLVAADAQMDLDYPTPTPEKSAGKKQNKHESHASHFFQSHAATGPLIFPQNPSSLPTVSYLALAAPQGAAEAPFRPPR